MSPSLFDLSGRVAVVTGANGKLGPVWVQGLLDAGARVFGIDVRAEAGVKLGTLLRNHRDRLFLAAGDICDRERLLALLRECISRFGAPAILVNNAAIDQPPQAVGRSHAIADIPYEQFSRVVEVNLCCNFLVAQVFGGEMVRQGSGSIINIGSLYAGVSPDERFYDHIECNPPFIKPPAYGTSKAGLVNLTRYLATHWAKHGVRVNALSPGGVLGGQDEEFKRKFCSRVPMGRMAEARDLVGPLLFLASDASSYVTGAELVVDGGFGAW